MSSLFKKSTLHQMNITYYYMTIALVTLAFSTPTLGEVNRIESECIHYTSRLAEENSQSTLNQALDACREAVKSYPEDATMAYYFANLLKTAKRDSEAFQWYLKAAKAGITKAKTAVGSAYVFGYGIQTDVRKGLPWWHEAAKEGDAEGAISLGSSLSFS